MRFHVMAALGVGLLALSAVPQAALAQDALAEPCTFSTSASDLVNTVMEAEGVNIDGFDNLCQGLNAARMGVDVAEYFHPQFDDEIAAVVMLRLYDQQTRVRGQESTMALALAEGTDNASVAVALSSAFNTALQNLANDLDRFTTSVAAENQRLAAMYQAPIPAPVADTSPDCRLTYVASEVLSQAIAGWGGVPNFEGYDALCAALRERGAGLGFAGGSALSGTRSQGWAAVMVFDTSTEVLGAATAFAISGTNEATEANLDTDLNQAVRAVLETLAREREPVLAALDEVNADNRRQFAPAGQ